MFDLFPNRLLVGVLYIILLSLFILFSLSWVVCRFLLSCMLCNNFFTNDFFFFFSIAFRNILFLYGFKSRVRSFEIQLASLFDNFFIENLFSSTFGLYFKQNYMHPGFTIASYTPGLNFKHLMQYRFSQ